MAETHPLIEVAELSDRMAGERPPVVLDVRWWLGGPPGIDAYRAGHLPGARYADLDRDLAGPPGAGGRHPLPDPDDFAVAMRRCGVRGEDEVVAYDDGSGVVAARAWWNLRYFGHLRVRVLNGGFAAWVGAGGAVTTEAPDVKPGDFVPVPGGMPVLDAAEAAVLARTGVLLDVRAPERYRGEQEPIDPVAGHVPGAVNAPVTDNLGSDGRLLPAAELRARFAGLGVTPDMGPDLVGAYCGSGVTAAAQVLALDVAGIRGALYVGSWSEWVTDSSRPVAVGDRP